MMEALLSGVSLIALKAFFPLALAPGLRRRGGGYQIARSLRFDGAAYMSFTPASGGNRDLLTVHFAMKHAAFGVQLGIIEAYSDANNRSGIVIGSGNQIQIYTVSSGSVILNKLSTRLLRDPTAWYKGVTVQINTATSAYRIWLGHEEITSWDTNTVPSAGTDTFFNANITHYIGRIGSGSYFQGGLCNFYVIDGQALDYTSFMELNATTGTWEPKAFSGTFGARDRYYKMDDNTSTATLGNDSSGNSLTATTSGFSVTAGTGDDSLTDTPTNYGTDTGAGGEVRGNYCTFNPLSYGGTISAPTNGNLDVVSTGTGYGQIITTVGMSSGKWKASFHIASSNIAVGVAKQGTDLSSYGGIDALSWVYASSAQKGNANSFSSYGASFTSGDVIDVEFDASAGTLEFFKNGASQGVAYTGLTSGPYFFVVSDQSSSGGNTISASANFGQRPWAYPYPTYGNSGFKALCTQNLSDPAVKKLSREFVSVIAAGASDAISTALAAARSGWSSYVDILKPYDTTGAWKWRFSHDASNEYSVSTTATRAAVSAPSANNWVGHSIKVGGTAGIRAGSQAHTNSGSDTTVTHNSGVSARQLILLFPRSGGEVLMYHPDATVSELLYLTGNEADFSSSLIKSVTANAFTIDTTHATDTYDYLVIPETEGFFKLFAHTGNASADGPAPWLGLRPSFVSIKVKSTTGDHYAWSEIRETYNPRAAELLLNTTAAAGTTADLDFLAMGLKIRATTAGYNGSAATHVGWAFGTPFKYARAV